MCRKSVGISVLYATLVAAGCGVAGRTVADVHVLVAKNILLSDGWDYETRAVGSVAGPCADGGDACRNRLGSQCSAEARTGQGRDWLITNGLSSWTLPPGERIVRVSVDAYGSWTNSVAGGWAIRVTKPPTATNGPLDIRTNTQTTSGGCNWLYDRAHGSGGWDITDVFGSGHEWSKQDIDALSVYIQRASASSPDAILFVSGFSVVVETECDFVDASIISAPTSACNGDTTTFVAAASGTGPFQYQWEFATEDSEFGAINGAVHPIFSNNATSEYSEGYYRCVVWTPCGSRVETEDVFLEVNPQASDGVWQLSDETLLADPCTLNYIWLVGEPDESFTLQWTLNGVALPGETYDDLLILGGSQPGTTDRYACVITDACGKSVSTPECQVYSARMPEFAVELDDVEVMVGQTAVLYTEIAPNDLDGVPLPIAWYWLRGEPYDDVVKMHDDERVSGSGSPILSIAGAKETDSGIYVCVIEWDEDEFCPIDTYGSLFVDGYCPIDLNLDGEVDLDDYFRFFYYFDRGDPLADLDESGEVDLGDFFFFFAHWDVSC